MIKRVILGVLRRVHNLFRPVTRRVAIRLRLVMGEAIAPLQSQVAELARRVHGEFAERPPLQDQIHELEQSAFAREEMLLAKIDSLDFKLLQLARSVQETNAAVRQIDAVVRLASDRASRPPDPAVHVSTAALSRNIEFIKARMSSFAGHDAVLTYLWDESPIFVNTGDMGCPSPIINGGIWEPENTEILCSFVTGSTKFLDIGANVGYFSIVVGNRVEKGNGKVIAFEPHPAMVKLIERSVQLNRLEPVVEVHGVAASDRDEVLELFYPDGHIGQGSSVRHFDSQGTSVKAPARRIDDALPLDLTVDLVKIDVEGAELAVIRGMEGVIRRSPGIKILFEKLAGGEDGDAEGIADFFDHMGLKLYGIGPRASLVPLDRPAYTARVGDILAVRDGVIDTLDRARFSVYPGQLLGSGQRDAEGTLYRASGDGILFFGPYWSLPAGDWTFSLRGAIEGTVHLIICSNDPALSFSFVLTAERPEGSFFAPRDLHQFELRGYGEDGSSIHLRQIDLVRAGV
jgi:FkbM family methyltransferase